MTGALQPALESRKQHREHAVLFLFIHMLLTFLLRIINVIKDEIRYFYRKNSLITRKTVFELDIEMYWL